MAEEASRYRILDRIGSGGIGVVHRVEDRATGEIRAMKVMPRASGTSNLRGEFLALARLHHDNVVAVHDYGLTDAGADFFTMDLVEGPPLLEAVPEVPSPAFYQLLGGVLRALSYLHSRRLLHADLKPSNILIDGSCLDTNPSQAAKLVDFGLSATTDDPTSSAARGTFPYAAPEVYAGRLDARSDLYALGVVLYEMLTGVQPYAGPTVAEVLRAQRRGPPRDPRELRDAIPDELAELIGAMLDPAPGARPQTADEVLSRINEIGGTDFTIADAKPLVDLTGEFVGRERDLAELWRWWGAAGQGNGGVALIAGDEGIGKSRLLAELKLSAQLEGGRVYTIDAEPRSEGPYAGITELVRGLLAGLGGRTTETVGEWRRTLAPLIGGQPEARPIDRSFRFALAEAVAGLLFEHASTQPILVTVDNVDRADPATVELLAYVARAVSGSNVLLVAAGRDDTVPEEPGSADMSAFATLARATRHAENGLRIDLPALDRHAVFRLAEQAFGRDIAKALIAELYRTTGGNPAHTAGALAELVRSGIIARKHGKWTLENDSPEIPLPPNAITSAMNRAQSLDPAALTVVESAAVLGDSFTRDQLDAVLDELDQRADIDAALAEAAAMNLLSVDAGAGSFRFNHAGVAAALASAIDEQRREAIHHAAIKRLASSPDISPSWMARHVLAVGDAPAALEWATRAAEEHASSYDHHGALAWIQLARARATDNTAALDERLGDLYTLVGDIDAARAACERAYVDTAPATEQHIQIALRLAELHRRLGNGEKALTVLMDGLGQARQARLSAQEAACQLRIGWVLMYRAEYKAAMEHAVAGLLIARAIDDRARAAELGRLRAAIEIYQGDTRSALTNLEASLEDAESTGDEVLIAGIQHEIGRAAIHAGDYARAITALERAITITEGVGYVEQAAKSLNNLGAACYFQGDWQRARISWERFRRLCERLDEQSELVNALNNLGSLYRELGQFAQALSVLDRGAEVARRTGHAHMGAMILANRGEVIFRQGDMAGGRECYQRAMVEFDRIGANEDQIETRRRLAEIDIAGGKLTAALDRVIDNARRAKDAGARLEEGILHRVAATALRLQGDLESALWFIEQSRGILAAMGARYERGKVELEAAEIAAAQGRTAEAIQGMDVAIESFASLGARWDLTRARARRRALPTERKSSHRLSESQSSAGFDLLLELTQASAAVALEALLDIALDKILALTRFERGFILLLDGDGRPSERKRRLRAGAKGFARDEAEFSGTIVRRVASSGEAVSVSDIAQEDELREQKSVVALGLRQIMCAPLRSHGRVIGIIYIDSRRLAFEEHGVDLPLLEAFAAQVALAIESARLRAEEKRKSELMAILAHEIRNPLAGILGYSDMGESDTAADSDSHELFVRIRRDAERLKRLVDNVLELARHESGNVDWSLTAFDVAELAHDIAASYQPMLEANGIEMKITIAEGAEGGVMALGNPDRIMQVLSNLVGNAIKFTPTGGVIVVSARREAVRADDPEAPPVAATEIGAWTPEPSDDLISHFIRVDVIDSGPGMSETVRDRLFQKFSQGDDDKRARGVGLGLYISREIITRHAGTIWAESELGHGATFSFRIPVA